MNIHELRTKSVEIANQARALLDTMTAENRSEKTAEFERMMADSDGYAQRAEQIERAEQRSKAFNDIVTKVESSTVTTRSTVSDEEKRAQAFDNYMRGSISLGEARALGVAVDEKGGLLAPTQFVATLLTSLKDYGPMLDPTFINYLTTSTGNEIEMPTFDDEEEAVIIGENMEIPEGDVSFGSKKLGAFKYTSRLFRVSNELLQDSAIAIEPILNPTLARRIGRGVNRHLTVGTGTNQPQGVVTSTQKVVTTAASTGIAAAELIKLQHAISAEHRADAKWMFNDATLLAARTMTDDKGAFIWAPGLTVDAPATILGRSYRTNPHMDDTFATGKVAAIYGNFKRYTVRQSSGVALRRLNERFADYDQVGFVALARFDGANLDQSAFAKLVIK